MFATVLSEAPVKAALRVATCLCLVMTAWAQCTAEFVQTLPQIGAPPPRRQGGGGGGGAPPPQNVRAACPGYPGQFFVAYDNVIESFEIGSQLGDYVLGVRGPPGRNTFAFGSLNSIVWIEDRSALFVLDEQRLVKVALPEEEGEGEATGTELVSTREFRSTARLAHNSTHVFIAADRCVFSVDVTLTSGWSLVQEIGTCQGDIDTIGEVQEPDEEIPELLALAWSENVLYMATASQMLFSFEDEDGDKIVEPGFERPVIGDEVSSMLPLEGWVVYASLGCEVTWASEDGSVRRIATSGASTYCGPTTVVAAVGVSTADSEDAFDLIVSNSGDWSVVRVAGCDSDQPTVAPLPIGPQPATSPPAPQPPSGLSEGPTPAPPTGPPGPGPTPTPPVTPAPGGNSQSNAPGRAPTAQAEGEDSNTLIIVIVAVVGVLFVAVIVAAAFIKMTRRSPEDQEPPAKADDVRPVDAHEPVSEHVSEQEMKVQPQPTPSPLVVAQLGPGSSSRAAPSTGSAVGRGSSVIWNADTSDVSRSDAATPGKKTAVSSLSGSKAGALSASAAGRSRLNRSDHSVVVSHVSRSDFDRSMQDTDEGLQRKLGLRAWSDAELRRHNRRCAFVRESAYQKGKLIGRGANGSVYAVLLHDGSTIAMKEAKLMGDEDEIAGQMAEVQNEMGLLSALHHDNLVTYYGVVCDEARMEVALFMENVTGGSLAALVRGMDSALPEDTAQLFTKQMLRGLAYIHQAGIVHRDLKCDNVLRDAHTGTVKLADFGTAKRLGNAAGASRAAQTMIGTPYFMAPEILEAASADGTDDSVGYGSKADIWSIGILVGELLNRGQPPWPAFPSPAHAFMHILNKDNAPELPAGLSEHCEDFIRQCTRRDPRERPSAVELLEHPWMVLASASDDEEGDGFDMLSVSRNESTQYSTTAPQTRIPESM